MKKTTQIIISLLAFIVLVAVVWVATQKMESVETTQENVVAVTIFPLYDMTQRIAGEQIDVVQVLPTGASPHTYEPTTSVVRDVANASVLYAIGSGLDEWAGTIGENAGTPVIELSEEFELLEGDDEHEHGHSGNPHIWLSVDNAIVLADMIAEDLAQRFPEHADGFTEQLAVYKTELEATDGEIRTILTAVENPNFITFHDSFPYFAQSYGLNLVGTFEPNAGQEPTPRYLEELQEGIEEAGVTVIYSEPQLSTSQLEPFVNDLGVEIVELDPLGGTSGRDSLIDLLLFNARTIADNQ